VINNVIEVKWKEFSGKILALRDKLSDDDQLTLNSSQREQFAGILQKRYGYTKEKAASELNEHYSKIKLG
jgi:uncharacterized protein YjbJ (UPF0337 family)